MSSSTSSFKRELKIVFFVAAVLLGSEVLLRYTESRLSLDIAHIRSAPVVATRLERGEGRRLLLMGNSFLREGVVRDELEGKLSEKLEAPVKIGTYHPDGTSVQEWRYAFRRYFVRPGLLPDVLIIFTGRTHLRDPPFRPVALGAFYCSDEDVPEVLRHRAGSVDEVCKFLFARWSVVFANRERVRPRFFSKIIPGYQEALQLMSEEKNRRLLGVETVPTFQDFEGLLQTAKMAGIEIILAPVPAQEPYELDGGVIDLAERYGAGVLDSGEVLGITADNFPDGWHLDHEGAALFTGRLTEELERMLSKTVERKTEI